MQPDHALSPGALESDELALDELFDNFGVIESLAISGREASRRGDRLTVETHLRQLRALLVAAIGTFKSIGAVALEARAS